MVYCLIYQQGQWSMLSKLMTWLTSFAITRPQWDKLWCKLLNTTSHPKYLLPDYKATEKLWPVSWIFLKMLLFYVFSCDQAALWMVQSVCLSVRPSVCHTFLTMFPSSYHHEIFRSYYQWQKWRPCKRSRSEVKEVNTQLNRYRTVTPGWIHIWWCSVRNSVLQKS